MAKARKGNTMYFRIYHEKLGGHVHMRVFAGRYKHSLGKCGDLSMRDDEFEEFVRRLDGTGVELLPDGEKPALASGANYGRAKP